MTQAKDRTAPLKPSRWRGTTSIGAGWAQYLGDAGDSTCHAHHAHQVVCGLEGPVTLWVDGPGEVTAPAVLVASGRSHRLAPGPVALLFVEATSVPGRRLSLACPDGYRLLDGPQALDLSQCWPGTGSSVESLAQIATFLGAPSEYRRLRRPAAQRVRQLLEGLPTRDKLPESIDELAAEVALSVSHFRRHLSSAVGLPYGPYLRWLRLQRALELAARGATLTRAAHESGFADASHLTRTMHEHFGVAPSDVLEALRAER
jgi:AraC-like DNA-binding protein